MIIRTSLRSLRRDTVTESELREAVGDIDEETSRLNRVVTDVLDFARPIRFDYSDTHINALCAASAQAAEAGEPGPAVTLDLDPADPELTTDAERLRTALVNVLSNARHAVEHTALVPGRGTTGVVTETLVRLRTRAENGRVTITVTDRGVGITPEDLPHIFDPYFTTRRTGTGLGLPIAKNIVDGLGGTITVSSRVGEGTEIRLDLPLHAPGA
jgi:two-component system sensor histidine kinase HydH